MRISATGNPPRDGEGDRRRQAVVEGAVPRRTPSTSLRLVPLPVPGRNGFTLVELLVVLAILGLASGAVILALPDPGGGVRLEAARLAARAQAAQERAVMDNRPVALVLKPQGYGFEWRSEGKWRAVGEKPLVQRSWDEGTQVETAGAEGRILFDSTGFAEPARIRLRRRNSEAVVEVADGGRVRVLP